MGLLSDSLYALFGDNIISVHVGGQGVFELRLNGSLIDYYKGDALISKEYSLSGTITRADGGKTSVHVDIKMGWVSTSYTLLIDGTEVPLIESDEAKIKEKIRDYGYDFEERLSTTAERADLLKEIKAQLVNDEDKKQGQGRGSVILVVSLVLFIVSFGFIGPFGSILSWDLIIMIIILVGVIFIHELGHLIGMRYFGYTDLKMFFIPFLGAAAYGKNVDAPRHHKAIVSLMGPIPGILLGFVLIGASSYMVIEAPMIWTVWTAAALLIIVNGFNLLPIKPLDGGWFLKEILFCRNIFLETWLN